MRMTLAIHPGSFDPITNGHIDVALRAAKLFDRIILAVYSGMGKPNALFPVEERIDLARTALANTPRPVRVTHRIRCLLGVDRRVCSRTGSVNDRARPPGGL